MTKLMKTLIAAAIGAGAMSLASANAATQPNSRAVDRDRPAVAENGANVNVRVSNNGRVDRRNGYNGNRRGVLNRRVIDTRHRARIILTEEIVRTRRGARLVCNVSVRGPEARYVSNKRLRRVARNQCSSRARININYS